MPVISLILVARVADALKNGEASYDLWRFDCEIPEDKEDDDVRESRSIQEIGPNGIYKENSQYAITAIDYGFFSQIVRDLTGELVRQFNSFEDCLAYTKKLHCELTSSGHTLRLFETVDI